MKKVCKVGLGEIFEKSDLSEGVEMGEKIWYNVNNK